MGKFFNERVKGNRNTLIKWGIIGSAILVILILFVAIANKGNKKNGEIVLVDEITIEIGGSKPSVNSLIKQNTDESFDTSILKIDDSNVNYNKIGSYVLILTSSQTKSVQIKTNIVDTKGPVLTVKDHEILVGEDYSVSDFVSSCSDNSKEKCRIEFYTEAVDLNHVPIDYSSFTEENVYTVKLLAFDQSGNKSDIQSATLVIKKKDEEIPTLPPIVSTCEYGDLTYSSELYTNPIAYIIGDEASGCALDLNSLNSQSVINGYNAFIKKDYDKLQTELEEKLETAFPNASADITYNTPIRAVFNNELKGIVGFEIKVEVYVSKHDPNADEDDKTSSENLKLEYYLTRDGSRQYIINEYGLD